VLNPFYLIVRSLRLKKPPRLKRRKSTRGRIQPESGNRGNTMVNKRHKKKKLTALQKAAAKKRVAKAKAKIASLAEKSIGQKKRGKTAAKQSVKDLTSSGLNAIVEGGQGNNVSQARKSAARDASAELARRNGKKRGR